MTANYIPQSTVESIVKQYCTSYEIIILQNGISSLPEQNDRAEEIVNQYSDAPIRKFQIQKRGKGNALNIGLQYARYDFICVLDADCVLEEKAIEIAMKHFDDENISAIGGKLKATSEKKNILTFCQRIEYMKIFNIWRVLFNRMNVNCLISGAFGIFRKSDLLLINGYDTDTVGEDMELVLSLQESLKCHGRKVIYENRSVCYTEIPCTTRRLFHQRDRWQRGLLDCLIKHRRLILNPRYGLLGCVALPFQICFELLGPIFLLFYLVNLFFAAIGFEAYFAVLESIRFIDIPQAWSIYFAYLVFEIFLTCEAEYLEYRRWYIFIIKIPEAVVETLLGTFLSVPLAVARIWGMITFRWRRLVW